MFILSAPTATIVFVVDSLYFWPPFWRCCGRLPRHVPLNRTLYASVVRSRSAALLFSRRRRRCLLLCLLFRTGFFVCVCVRSQQLFPSIPGYTILLDNLECVLTIFQFRSIFSACQFCILFLHTFLSPAPPTCLSLLFAFLFIVFHALFYVSTLTRDCVCVRAFVCACKLCKRCIDFEFQCE